MQQSAGAVIVISQHLQAHERRVAGGRPKFFEVKLVVNFGVNPSAHQPCLQSFRFGALAKRSNRKPVHNSISFAAPEMQVVLSLPPLLPLLRWGIWPRRNNQ